MRKNTFRLVLLIFISFCGAALNSAEINQTNNRAVSRKFSETDELIYEYLVKNQNIFYDYVQQLSFLSRLDKPIVQHYQSEFENLPKKDLSSDRLEQLFLLLVRIQFSHCRRIDDAASDIILRMLKSKSYSLTFMSHLARHLSADYVDNNLDDIIRALKENPQINRDFIRHITFSPSAKQKYRDYFSQLILESKEEIRQLEKKDDRDSMNLRNGEFLFCAHFDDGETYDKVMDLFSHSTEKDIVAYINILAEFNTRESITAILSKFADDIGAPSFFTGESPRYRILVILYNKYPEDPFFASYKKYLNPGTVFSASDPPSDSFLGKEEGVKKLFAGLQDWAKERLKYELSLEKSTPKINSGPKYRKIYR